MAEQALRSIAVPRQIPVVLSFVAGYVDSCTYLGLFGVFVAQVTGSFVLGGAELVRSEPGALARLLAIPFFFVAGVAITILVHSMRDRPRSAFAWCLVVECILLIGFITSCLTSMPFRGPDTPSAIVALMFGMTAMSTQSAMVRLLMRGMPSTNVMTTNTTMLAISAGEILVGCLARHNGGPALNADYAQARTEFVTLLSIALGFLAGTAVGAIAYITVGLLCVLLAILPIGSLAVWYMRHL